MTACLLCPGNCRLSEGETGRCRARANQDGRIVPLGYGKLTSIALDPVEKKPLYHFHPGKNILSVGSFGCNMSCFFCQNAAISFCGQQNAACQQVSPHQLVDLAERTRAQDNIGVAFTYNEPLINYEYILDCARLLKARGMQVVLVTNGNFHTEPLQDLLPLVDAMNIDLKGFHPGWVARLGGHLPAIKQFIQHAAGLCHVEVTTLVVPGENDSESEMDQLSAWLASLDRGIPLHISRFFPRYLAQGYQPTKRSIINALCRIARKHLDFVHPGNM